MIKFFLLCIFLMWSTACAMIGYTLALIFVSGYC